MTLDQSFTGPPCRGALLGPGKASRAHVVLWGTGTRYHSYWLFLSSHITDRVRCRIWITTKALQYRMEAAQPLGQRPSLHSALQIARPLKVKPLSRKLCPLSFPPSSPCLLLSGCYCLLLTFFLSKMVQQHGSLPTMLQPQAVFQALALGWYNPGCCGHLGRAATDGISLSLSSLWLCLCHIAFQINTHIHIFKK